MTGKTSLGIYLEIIFARMVPSKSKKNLARLFLLFVLEGIWEGL